MRRQIAVIQCNGIGCRKQVTGDSYDQATRKAKARGWKLSFSAKRYGWVDYCPKCRKNPKVQVEE